MEWEWDWDWMPCGYKSTLWDSTLHSKVFHKTVHVSLMLLDQAVVNILWALLDGLESSQPCIPVPVAKMEMVEYGIKVELLHVFHMLDKC